MEARTMIWKIRCGVESENLRKVSYYYIFLYIYLRVW